MTSAKSDSDDSIFSCVVGPISWVSAVEESAHRAGMYPVKIRGTHSVAMGEMLSEFAGACQFPVYFGCNLDALEECLNGFFDDGYRFENRASGLMLILVHADKMLTAVDGVSGPRSLELLVSILKSVMGEIRAPSGILSGCTRVSRKLSVCLQFDDPERARDLVRWEACGAYHVVPH